jgi:hypothetical protein
MYCEIRKALLLQAVYSKSGRQKPVLRVRDVFLGPGSRIQGQEDSEFASMNLDIFNSKNCWFLSCRKNDLARSFRIRIFSHPGSGG